MSGSQCCSNPPTLSSSSGAGVVEEVGGLKSYITGSLDSGRAVLLAADVFGYEAPKLRKLADKVAAGGFYVVVPDFFDGDAYTPDNPERPLSVWLRSYGTDKASEDAQTVVQALKNKGISAIGAAGFCWGAKIVVHLAQSDDIKAAVLLHPSFVTADDITEVKVPLSVLGAEVDKISPPALLKQFDEILSVKPEVDCHVKIFPGMPHGWTVRYRDDDKVAMKCAMEAQENMLEWLTKYVK